MDPYASSQTYLPPPSSSQIQPQNQNQDQYLYNQQQQYDQSQQQYPYYPQISQQQYPNPNPNSVYSQHLEVQEPVVPIHPPGVPIQNHDPSSHMAAYQHGYNTANFQNDPYYPQSQQALTGYSDPGLVHQQWQQQQGQTAEYGLTSLYPTNGQSQNSGSGRGGGGRGFRGGGSSFRGRGRGGGRGRIGKTTVSQPKPACMAWCELCRVDCNTLEILENHKNGKKHKKNLKVQEDLQKLAAAKAQEAQMAAAVPDKPENSGLTKVESQSQAVETPEQGGGSGLKRKKRDGEKKSGEAAASKKPKEIVPFICELCDVKCESAPTFDSHLKGKKHAFNLQRFQEQQASLGQAALQALYPALEALYPALIQALSQSNVNASTSTANGVGLDQQVLQWLQAYLPQNGLAGLPQGGPESAPVVPQGLNQEGGPIEEGANQVEPTVKIEEQAEPVAKIEEEKVEPVVKIEEEKVEPTVKSEEKVESVTKIEEQVEKQVETESKAAETNQ